MPRFYFTLDISPTEYLRYYQGTAVRVHVRASDGRRLSIPAAELRRFVTHDGIRGSFSVTVDAGHKLIALERYTDAG